jgi:hypothetical protein
MLEPHQSKYDLASNINTRIICNLSIPIAINFSDILTKFIAVVNLLCKGNCYIRD